MRPDVDVLHLVGLPFEEAGDVDDGAADCAGIVRAVLRENGRERAAAMIAKHPLEAIEVAKRLEAGEEPGWLRVGSTSQDATELLDILVGPGRDWLHVAIVVHLRPKMVVTSFHGRGCCLHPIQRFRHCRSVLRPLP
ncbi:MAG: hypothetical protein AAFP86_07695 [Planctomycetota bacterium]